jgi:hypothetical protein
MGRPVSSGGIEESMKRTLSFAVALATLLAGASAGAQDLPTSIDENPRGPGTERPWLERNPAVRLRPGWEAAGQIGGGIGLGVGARAGYSFVEGVYLGGSLMHFFGPSVDTLVGSDNESQTIFGADLGYKLYPRLDVELRPFLFTGVGFFNRFNENVRIVDQSFELTVSPAFLAAYHFGNAFLSAESRLQVAPAPVRFALLAGIGMGI